MSIWLPYPHVWNIWFVCSIGGLSLEVNDDECIEFVGRSDYPAKDEFSEEEHVKIDAFIKDQAEAPTMFVYHDQEVEMVNEDIYRLLWGLETRQSVFEEYVGILN